MDKAQPTTVFNDKKPVLSSKAPYHQFRSHDGASPPAASGSKVSRMTVKKDPGLSHLAEGSKKKGTASPATTSRYDSSLSLLTKKFLNLLQTVDDGIIDLNQAADMLGVQKRRIYDITNVLEGINLIEKKSKNHIQWKGSSGGSDSQLEEKIAKAQKEVLDLQEHERKLDEHIRSMRHHIRQLGDNAVNQSRLYVTHNDIMGQPCFGNDIIFAVKAPRGTTLEVPNPDALTRSDQKYKVLLKSKEGQIDVFLISNINEEREQGDAGVPSQRPSETGLHGAQLPSFFSETPPSAHHPITPFTTQGMKADLMKQEAEAQALQQHMPDHQAIHHGMRSGMGLPPMGHQQPPSPGCIKLVPQEVSLDCNEWFAGDAAGGVADIWQDDPDILSLDASDWLLPDMGKQ